MKASAEERSSRRAATGLPTGTTLGAESDSWQIAGDYVRRMPLDAELLAELKDTKAQIDTLQARLKELVARLQETGASPQEIASALRS